MWPDPTGAFAAYVYSGRGAPLDDRWERHGATVIHAGGDATCTGATSADGTTIRRRWRPDPGQHATPGSAYDAVMRRVD